MGGGLHHPGALAALQEAREGNPIFFHGPPHQGPVGWHLRCRAWGVSPLAAASFFLDAQKEAKEAPGGATGRTSALRPRSPCCLPPGPPFYGGRQLGSSCGFPKGAGGVGIDVASPTAAAAWVGFPVRRFPRLRARLWHGGAQVARWGGAGGDFHHPGASAAPQEAREENITLFRCPPHQGPVARRGLGLSTQVSTRRNCSTWN